MIPSLSEKKALALAGGCFLSNSCYSEHLTDVRLLGYPYNSIKSPVCDNELDTFVPERKDTRGGNRTLGITTINVSTSSKVIVNRYKKYDVLRSVKSIIEGMGFRTSGCLKALGESVEVVRTGNNFHYRKLLMCGSTWLCPVCASKISEARKKELTRAVNKSGYYPVLVSVTLQHKRGDSLVGLVDVLNSSLRSLKAGRQWNVFREKYGVKAYVSSLEFTYSEEAGWHPHKHLLFFLESGDISIQAFKEEITKRYAELVGKAGGYASLYHSIDVQGGTYSAGNYLSKWGLASELTKANLKGGRKGSYSMWELAELGRVEEWARQAFREYAGVTYGKKAITWSHGARKVLGLGAELTDEEIAEAEEVDEEVITTIPREAWKLILLTGNEAHILLLAEAGGKEAVDAYVTELVEGFRGSG